MEFIKKRMKKLGFKIWLLIIMVSLSLISIFGIPPKILENGVAVQSVEQNSTFYEQGIRPGDIIKQINGVGINSLEEYFNFTQNFFDGEEKRVEIKIKNLKSKTIEYVFLLNDSSDLIVKKIPKTNLKLGLDLAGGSRAIVKAENKTLSSEEIADLVDITANRLDAFGLTDLVVRKKSDLSGNNFMEIEIAGATTKDLRNLISEQGEFIAVIGNETVFRGGEKDVASVGRDAQNARITGCGQSNSGYYCNFMFTIVLSPSAAQKQADLTSNLSVVVDEDGERRLSEKLNLYLDGNLVESLGISEGLKGRAETQISITGAGTGPTEEEALASARQEMKHLQTILLTGSLPYKLEIVKLDTISPTLGNEFNDYILLTGLLAMIIVALILFLSYRSAKISMSLMVIVLSEIIIILGITSLIQSNLDLLAIAGVLATFGTGVDDQIVMIDESRNRKNGASTVKQRIKNAFQIIMGAYFTVVVSLLPLFWAGAGSLKGFALTTIIGISAGVFITRPAFGEILKRFTKD